jgi:phage gpG-like protein
VADVIWDLAALTAILESPAGPVGRDLARRAVLVETAAKESMGGGYPPPSQPGEPPHLRSGRLRASISWRLGEDAEGLYADIGSNVEYAYWVEMGSDRMAARPYLRPALPAAAG